MMHTFCTPLTPEGVHGNGVCIAVRPNLPPNAGKIRPVGRVVYSCKSAPKADIIGRILQVNKNARRNGRAFLWELMSHLMAFPARFELTACRLGGDRSIRLSYGNI